MKCGGCVGLLVHSVSQMKLELVTGATASMCELLLYDTEGKLVCGLDNDDAPLSSYPANNGFRVHVRTGRVAGTGECNKFIEYQKKKRLMC